MSAPRVVDTEAIGWLGRVIHKIRPQWDAPGIRSALERALGEGHPFPDVAHFAVAAARDPSCATPGAIPTRCRTGWTGPDDPAARPTPTPDDLREVLCRNCGGIATEPNHDEHCGRRAQPGARARAFAELGEEEP